MKKAIGIDIGNLTTKAVIMEDGRELAAAFVPSGDEAGASAKSALDAAWEAVGGNGTDDVFIVTTGMHAKEVPFSHQQKAITTCLARGVITTTPETRLIVDIGAESSTVVKINERGRVSDWANHDKCASGTGIFLQQMAKLLGMTFEEMAELSISAKEGADITPTCAVFAESEVISHIHRVPPTPRDQLVLGIHQSVVSRLMSMCKRVGIVREVTVTGGVAFNSGIIDALERELGFGVLAAKNPLYTAAAGAAVLAQETIAREVNV